MSDDQNPKDGGSTDELPTLPGPDPSKHAASPAAQTPARPDAMSIEPVTQKKPSGTVIIQERAKPPASTQMADPLAATLPVGSPVGPTLPGDAQRRPQSTMLEPSGGAPAAGGPQHGQPFPGAAAPARAASNGAGMTIVYAIAGGALALGIVIGAVFYLTRGSGDDDAAPEPTIALHDAGATTSKPTVTTPAQNTPTPPVTPTPPPTEPVAATPPKPSTPTQPVPTTSSSAPPADANNTLPRFPTSFPTAMPTGFPTVLPTAFPSTWPPK